MPLSSSATSDFFRGFDSQMEKNSARRLENRKALMELSDVLANQGVAVGMEEMADLAGSVLGAGDFLNSTAVAPALMDRIRMAQNSKARQVAEERRRAQFTTDMQEANAIEAEVAKQAEAGKSEGEIAVWLSSTYGERAKTVIPRLTMLMNKASLSGQQQGMQLGASLWTEEEARKFIDSNPSLTESMKQGVLLRARQNNVELEKQVHAIGDRIGSSGGFVDGETVRKSIETLIPSYITDPALRSQLTEKAMNVARASAQTKLAATQADNASAAQKQWAVDAPRQAAAMAEMEMRDQQARTQAAQTLEQRLLGGVANQQQFVKDLLNDKAKKLKEKTRERVTALASQYLFTDMDGLVQAVDRGDEDAVQRLVGAARPIASQAERARKMADFLNNADRAPSVDIAVQNLSEIVVDAPAISKAGSAYRRFSDASGGAMETTPRMERRKVRVPVTNSGGAVIGYTMEERDVPVAGGTPTPMAQVNAQSAQQVRSAFVKDASAMVQGAADALRVMGRFDIAGEQMQQIGQNMAQRMAAQFVAGMGLPAEEAQKMVARLTMEIMAAAGPVGPATKLKNYVDRYRESIQNLQSQGGVGGPSFMVPGSVQPSPRLNQPF